MFHCVGDDVSNVKNKTDCLSNPNNTWTNAVFNYDNIVNSFLTLFVIATLDGWVDQMYNGIDAVGEGMQPIKNNNEYMALYFIIYLFIVAFFVLNMFVGVIVDNFQMCDSKMQVVKKKVNKIKSYETKETFFESKIYINESIFFYSNSKSLWMKTNMIKLVKSKYFDIIIAGIIILNVICMAIDHYKMSQVFFFIICYC